MSEIGWNTRAMAQPTFRSGITPSKASNIVREFVCCPNCGSDLDPNVNHGLYEDRDVVWENRENGDSQPHTCSECNTDLNIFVEEKAFGIIGKEQLPTNAEEMDQIYFVPVKDGGYLVINEHQIWISSVD